MHFTITSVVFEVWLKCTVKSFMVTKTKNILVITHLSESERDLLMCLYKDLGDNDKVAI